MPTSPTEDLADRVFAGGVGAVELGNIYLGVHLGLYRALAQGPTTVVELAERTGCDRRYLREWLQGQAISGFAVIDGEDPATARFTLAPGGVDVLVDETAPNYQGGLADLLAAMGRVLPALAEAYRSGAGVPYAAYGADAISAQSSASRPGFLHSLVSEWLPQIPDVQDRLRDATRPARVADLACGTGWAAIALAQAYPHLRVDGMDSDEASIAAGRRYAEAAGVADRVHLDVVDLSDAGADWSPRYDLITFFECLHDLPRPVEALGHARAALAPGGTVLVVDERADDTLTVPGDPVQRFLGAISPVWCLPQGLVGDNPEPVGTVIRPDQVRDLAARGGFSGLEILPIEHPFSRFYRLSA